MILLIILFHFGGIAFGDCRHSNYKEPSKFYSVFTLFQFFYNFSTFKQLIDKIQILLENNSI